MSSKQDLLMVSLTQFFKIKKHLTKMTNIVEGKSIISLRILDWFVTNYSKKNNTSYDLIGNDGNLIKFIVFIDYKSQLKAYSKKQFDPFCRRERISFYDHDNNEIVTTVGQLNFFRWSIENKILEYVENNIKIIESDMNSSIKHIYKTTTAVDNGKKQRRKRQELSISATKTVNKHDVKIVVTFD
jgi:hypothetical protein